MTMSQWEFLRGLGIPQEQWSADVVAESQRAASGPMSEEQASRIVFEAALGIAGPGSLSRLAEAEVIENQRRQRVDEGARAAFNQIVDQIARLAESKLGMTSIDARTHARSEAMVVQERANTVEEAIAGIRAVLDTIAGGRTSLIEHRTFTQARPRVIEAGSATASGEGRLSVCLITAGQGSSGTYPAETLRKAAEARVFHAGLHLYVDHPTPTEDWERPGRSVRDLAGALATDATYRDGGLYAEARVFSSHWDLIAERATAIGMSIRASADVRDGIVHEIFTAESVDFVTHAGRGGHIVTAY